MKKIAILYDFDKTLSTRDMQEFGFLHALGFEKAEDFWALSTQRAQSEHMDSILAYLYEILVQAKLRSIPITRAYLNQFAHTLEYYPGVETWFNRLNEKAKHLNLDIEHYIISSGLTEIMEQSLIAPFVKKIYACEYLYDAHGHAVWPKLSVNYTVKTQFLFRINKGILEISEDAQLNRYVKESERPIPFQRMIYVGDGLTDVPSMKLIKSNGGFAIGVYPKGSLSNEVSQQLMSDQRVDALAEANYSAKSELESIIFKRLERLAHETE